MLPPPPDPPCRCVPCNSHPLLTFIQRLLPIPRPGLVRQADRLDVAALIEEILGARLAFQCARPLQLPRACDCAGCHARSSP
eukprot:1497771-Lingulodinium_polyedra.AAC.1